MAALEASSRPPPAPAHLPWLPRCAPTPQANAARLMWNSTGSAVLALTAADVDATNQSYYGAHLVDCKSCDEMRVGA